MNVPISILFIYVKRSSVIVKSFDIVSSNRSYNFSPELAIEALSDLGDRYINHTCSLTNTFFKANKNERGLYLSPTR